MRFLDRHPRSSIFHTRGWLEALHRTYGYEPVVYTTASPLEELGNGIVFCKIDSWITGRRLVSLPFSDHCEPLVDGQEEWRFLISSIIEDTRWEGCKSVEIRPAMTRPEPVRQVQMALSNSFFLHTVDLVPGARELFSGFHVSCVQRKIRRAERERLAYVEGCSQELVGEYHRLLMVTRRRHRFPPQPLAWFKTLVDCLAQSITIHIARRDDRPIAGIVTVSFKNHIYYKYGCADRRYHDLGGMQLLLWRAIQQGKESGAEVLDLGRSDANQKSLATFKDHWGGTRSLMTYYRYPAMDPPSKFRKWTVAMARRAFTRLPDALLATAGRLVYPHMG